MRLHTNLTAEQIRIARRATLTMTHFETLSHHGSRTHDHAFEVRLGGSGGRNNTGLYGAGDYCGATWDEWGAVMGAIYMLDPAARWGGAKNPQYADAEDFHFKTRNRFKAGILPADTHARHKWVYAERDGFYCSHKAGCTAEQPSYHEVKARRVLVAA